MPTLRESMPPHRRYHRRLSFQEEFRRLLAGYQVEFDERYVWD